MNRILILDDDHMQLNFLENLLIDKFECIVCTNPLEAISILNGKKIDAIITDLHMPVINGIEFIKKIREFHDFKMPVFIFSSDESLNSKLECLNLDIEDYLHTGMDGLEIILRIDNKLRRKNAINTLCFGEIIVNQDLLQVHFCHQIIDLTQIEYKILIFLLQNKGKVEKKKLISFCWPGKFVIEKTLNTHMTNLRNKMKEFGYTLITTKSDDVIISTTDMNSKQINI